MVWKSQTLKIFGNEYNYPLKVLCDDKPQLDSVVGGESCEMACRHIWGNLEQYNPIISSIEKLIANMGEDFIFEGAFYGTMDDDKLCHSSTKFWGEGLQMTGFRGSNSDEWIGIGQEWLYFDNSFQ